ncbi:MAG: Ig-like domain-containing protein, partial [Thermoplasmata archaeon]
AEGAVLSPVKTVNSVAKSSVTYPSASAGREIKLTASAGGKEGSITFSLPGFSVSYISVSAEQKTLLADGKDSTMVKATLFDKNGSSANVPDGTTVSFTTDAGTLNPFVTTTVNGEAVTWLRSDKTPQTYIKITAQSGLYSDFTYVHFEEVGSTVNQVSDIDIALDKNEVEADGISSVEVTATLKKFNGEIIDKPTTVEFETDIGQITHYATSNTEGKAIAHFSSGQVGTATISVTVGNAVGYASVIVKPGPPKSVELIFPLPPGEDADTYEPYVYVKGSGQNETLIVSATVKDSKNNYVADGNLVKFELVGTFDNEDTFTPEGNIHSVSSPVPTLNGLATVSFHSGKRAGSVRMKATVINPQTGLPYDPPVISETTQILVYAGPPYLDTSDLSDPFTNSRMTVYSGPINIYADQTGTEYNRSTITVTIADKYNNPVPPGTSVYFTTSGGYITTNTGYTNANGMATVTLYGGNPYPTIINSGFIPNPNNYIPGSPASFALPTWSFDPEDITPNNGIAVITAQTEGRDQNGNNITVFNYAQVVFSRTVTTFTITADKDSVYRSDKADLIITVHDINENPIVGGSKLTLSSTLGTLSQKSITTGEPGRIKYRVTLTNDLDPLAGDDPGWAVVTVSLESPNGSDSIEKSIYLSTSSF